MARRLTRKQREYIENRARGIGKRQSAVMAGYSDDPMVGRQVEESNEVQAELARIRAETAKSAGVTKEMVAQMLLEAYKLAKDMADPVGLVAAARELGKLLGHYAPEVKKLEKSINKAEMKQALEELTDDELRRIARGRVIDGTFKVENERPDPPQLPDLQAK